MTFISVIQSWIFSNITPVSRVTWFFRNHSNIVISMLSMLCYFIFLWKPWCTFLR